MTSQLQPLEGDEVISFFFLFAETVLLFWFLLGNNSFFLFEFGHRAIVVCKIYLFIDGKGLNRACTASRHIHSYGLEERDRRWTLVDLVDPNLTSSLTHLNVWFK